MIHLQFPYFYSFCFFAEFIVGRSTHSFSAHVCFSSLSSLSSLSLSLLLLASQERDRRTDFFLFEKKEERREKKRERERERERERGERHELSGRLRRRRRRRRSEPLGGEAEAASRPEALVLHGTQGLTHPKVRQTKQREEKRRTCL